MSTPARRPRHGYRPASKWISRPVPGSPCIAQVRVASDAFQVVLPATRAWPEIKMIFNSNGRVEDIRIRESTPLCRLGYLMTAVRTVAAFGGAEWIRENASPKPQKEASP